MSSTNVSFVVLLVEDSEDDRFFFEHAFNQAESDARLFMAKDGIEAIEFLQRARSADNPPLPNIMFLDLKMPDCDGFDVLRWMEEHSLLKTVKVFILSGSSEPQDVALAKELGASDYLVKPLRFKRLKELLSAEGVASSSHSSLGGSPR